MHKRILLTAGGTGGHIYPLLAVADKLLQIGEGHFDLEYIGLQINFMMIYRLTMVGAH